MLTQHELDVLVRRIADRTRPQRIIVFGSYAKGTATATSDLDLVLVKETCLPAGRRADELGPLLNSVLIPVDVHVYTPEEVEEYGREEFSFLHSVLRSGVTVFEA